MPPNFLIAVQAAAACSSPLLTLLQGRQSEEEKFTKKLVYTLKNIVF